MSVFGNFFRKKKSKTVPPIPSWDEIVVQMQGKGLDAFADTVVQVIPSIDRAKRIVILRSENRYFKVVYEEIRVYDEDIWPVLCKSCNRYAAWWEPVNTTINSASFYGTQEDAIKEITSTLEYKTYFK